MIRAHVLAPCLLPAACSLLARSPGSGRVVPRVWVNGALVPVPDYVEGTTDQELGYR